MASTVAVSRADCQGQVVALAGQPEDNSHVRLLREAIDESGWKHDAIAAVLGIEAAYLSKMLSGEKAIGLKHLRRLPRDVARCYVKKCGEALGLIVVMPLSGVEAQRAFIAGALGMLGGVQ
jgi:hypothetical protein